MLASVPTMSSGAEELSTIEGTVPDPVDFPAGCRFAPRCDFAVEVCGRLQALEDAGGRHLVRCGEWQRVVQAETV